MASIVLPRRSRFALALREPNLLIPGVYGKPVNQVRINHNNHFSYGLFSAHYVWNCLTNLSDNSVIPIGGSASIASSIVGMSVLSNGSSPMYAGALYPDSTNFTALTVYLPVASSSSNHVMWYDCNTVYSSNSSYNGFGGGSIREIHFGISNTNEWNFTGQLLNNAGGCSATLSKTIDVGKPYVLVGVSDAYQAKLWVDGVKGNDAAIQSAGVANAVTRLVNRVADSGRSDRYMRGYSPIFLCWNRVLSDSEIREITKNPYQVFKPANDTPYLFPVAGGGGVSGTGDLVGAGSQVVGTGTRSVTGTGALEGQGAEVVGTATRTITGTGALVGQGSDVAGTGAAGGTHTGTGDLVGAGSEIVGVGERTVTGTGALVAQGSAVAGVGERTVTGSGDLVGAGAEVSGSGAIGGITTGTGDLVGAGSEVVGTGLRTVTGTGALVAQGSAVTGTAERTIVGAGALVGSGSEIVGAGVGGDVTTGAGALVGAGSAVTGTGTRTITGVGDLVAAGSIIVGAGVRTITGSGALVGAGSAITGSSAHEFVSGNTRRTWLLSPRGREWSLSRSN